MSDTEELGEKMFNLFPESHRLKDGINLNDLVQKMNTEFTLDCSKGEYEEPVREQAIDKLHDFEDYEPHLNFNCFESINAEEKDLPFDELKKLMTPVTEDGKIMKMVCRHGAGDTIPPKAVVYCHYNFYFELEEVPFDSSYLRQQRPERYQMGVGSMFSGFEKSLETMKKGEKSRFLVESCYAFGKLGAPPRIPADSTVLLEIELIKVVDCGDTIEESSDMFDKIGLTFEEYYKSAKANHLLGNDLFQSKNVQGALEKYKKAEKNLLKCSMNNENEEDKYCKLLLKVYVNLCICYNHPKINTPQRVCVTAREAFQVCRGQAHKCTKLLFNLAKAQISLSDFEKSKKNLNAALKLEPHNQEINNLLKKVDEKREEVLQEERITYQRALGLKEKKKEEVMSEIPSDNEFEKELLEGLEEFYTGDLNRLDFPPGFTNNEIVICKKVCEKLGLQFHDQTIRGRRSLYITK